VQHPARFDLAKPQPQIRVELACLLEAVPDEIQHDDASAGFQDAKSLRQCALRMLRMVQGLAEQGDIYFPVSDRQGFQIAFPVTQVAESVLARKL
jgi:hypothetical protein